jgi:hypothetical protein
MAGGRRERGSGRRARAVSVVVPFPGGGPGNRLELAQVVPSGRFLLLAFGLVGLVLVLYRGAHVSSVFDVERIDVQGAPPAVARDVERVTKRNVGKSLLTIDAGEVEGRVRSLPSVAGASVDRAFPHTLVIKVAPERAVAVIRRGHSSWLVTGAGRVIREIETGTQRALPRLWLERGVAVRIGGSLPAAFTEATRALGAVHDARLPRRVKAVRSSGSEMTLVLRRGPEIRLGEPRDLLLKLAVAAQVYRLVDSGTLYIDVSVPERPVAGKYLDS